MILSRVAPDSFSAFAGGIVFRPARASKIMLGASHIRPLTWTSLFLGGVEGGAADHLKMRKSETPPLTFGRPASSVSSRERSASAENSNFSPARGRVTPSA